MGITIRYSGCTWFILASLIAPGLKRVGSGSLDRWLGVLFGFVRGYGLVLIVFVAAVFAAEGEDNLLALLKSHTAPLCLAAVHIIFLVLCLEIIVISCWVFSHIVRQ